MKGQGHEKRPCAWRRGRRRGIVCAVLAGMALLPLLTGCGTQYVPVETVVTEYVHSTDTVHEKDTVMRDMQTVVREASPADSAMLAQLGLEIRENQRIILVLRKELERQSHEKQESHTDTVYRDRETQVPYPVERRLSRWEAFCIDYGKITLGTSIAAAVAAAVLIVLWIRRKTRL